MGSHSRNANIAVKETLKKETFKFDFHQAVELLGQLSPEAKALGEGGDPTNEALTIKSRVSLSPSSSEIHSFSLPAKDQKKPILWINFMGIAGIQGPLPTPYTELLLQRNRLNDYAFRDFLDIFNHRFASLWYKLKKQTFISYSQKDPRKTKVGRSLISISGIANESYRDMIHVSERTLLSYHDLLWHRPKSSYGLIRVLETHFNTSINVEQFQGSWVRVSKKDCTTLGAKKGAYNKLGKQTILGNKVWNQDAGIRIDIGPTTWEKINQLMPRKIKNADGKVIMGRDHNQLKDLIFFYAGMDYKIKIRFKIYPINVKPLRLNKQFGLGLNSWLSVGKKLKTPCHVDVCIN